MTDNSTGNEMEGDDGEETFHIYILSFAYGLLGVSLHVMYLPCIKFPPPQVQGQKVDILIPWCKLVMSF